MGDAMQAFGVGPQFTLDKDTYQFVQIDGAGYALFEAWLERQAVDAIRRQRSYLTATEFREERSETNRDIAAQIYSFGSERFTQALRSVPGLKEICRLGLRRHHPGADEELVDRLFDADQPELIRIGLKLIGIEVAVPESPRTEPPAEEEPIRAVG